jgi:hypothetical protein
MTKENVENLTEKEHKKISMIMWRNIIIWKSRREKDSSNIRKKANHFYFCPGSNAIK